MRKTREKYDTDKIVEKFKSVHGDKYDYSLVEYQKIKLKVKILCLACKEIFEQNPYQHYSGEGCPNCGGTKRLTHQKFVEKANSIHGIGEFDYSLDSYKSSHTLILIKHKCGHEFRTKPANHIHRKSGCPECNGGVCHSKEKFVEKAVKIHGDKYDYSDSEYKNSLSILKIFCKDCNKHFKQKAAHHVGGAGCQRCCESRGERLIANYLDKMSIKYIRQYRDKTCKCSKVLSFDFYLPDYDIFIEYDGEQHFAPIHCWGGVDSFNKIVRRDKAKNNWILNNNKKLFRISYKEISDDFIVSLFNKLN